MIHKFHTNQTESVQVGSATISALSGRTLTIRPSNPYLMVVLRDDPTTFCFMPLQIADI